MGRTISTYKEVFVNIFLEAHPGKRQTLEQMENTTLIMILLSLSDETFYEVVEEKTLATLWLKLEKFVIKKFIYNKLLLKTWLFVLCKNKVCHARFILMSSIQS